MVVFMFSLSSFSQKVSDSKFQAMLEDLLEDFEVPQLSVGDLEKMLASDDVIVLDAREKKEFAVSHLKEAEFYSKPLSSYKNKKIVVYCSVGYRSSELTKKLRDLGYDAYNLWGGIFEWKNSGHQVYRNGTPTEDVHTYNKSWSQWLTSGNKVY